MSGHNSVMPDDVAEQTACANDGMVRGRGTGQAAARGGLARGEAGAAGGVLHVAGAADGDAGAEAMGAAMDDPFLSAVIVSVRRWFNLATQIIIIYVIL